MKSSMGCVLPLAAFHSCVVLLPLLLVQDVRLHFCKRVVTALSEFLE